MFNTAKTKKHHGGYALLEILLAFAVASIILVGLVSLGVATVKAVTVNRAYSEAGKIAQREVDRLRLLRDTSTDWATFKTAVICSPQCYLNVSTNPFSVVHNSQSVSVGNGTVVYYFSASANADPNRIDYTVNTTWTVGAVSKTYKIEGALTKWKEL